MKLLKLQQVSAGYEETPVLHEINIEVDKKQIVSLIGPNGAGKSTVLKTVFGLTKQTSGNITYKEKNITNKQTHELLKLGISYVPQGRINFTTLTVQENLQLTSKQLTNPNKRIQELYKQFPNLKKHEKTLAYNLSGGEQQMLALARALMHKPQLLLLDEPTLGLSPKLIKELFKTLQELRKEGISLLVVEQNAKQAIQISDYTYVLEQGSIALEGDKTIQQHPKIQSIYLGGDTKE
ncbi:MAG: ABC transporter ATP-binding protein [Candidatus Woesearchaeota archaeon]